MNKIDLAHKRAIVTGGARGTGREITRRLLASGADVVVWGREADLGHHVSTLKGAEGVVTDTSDPESVGRSVIQSARILGGIDILINNPGTEGEHRRVWESGPDDWAGIIATHLNGVFHCCRALVPHMRDSGYGRIVNITSIAGKEGQAAASAYAAASAGVIALTKSLALEVAKSDVMVNCVTPAVARTADFADYTPEGIAALRERIPMKRFLEAEELAGLVAWLSSEECSFTTGQVLDISGGQASY